MARGALFVMFHQPDPPLTLDDARRVLTRVGDGQIRYQGPFMIVHDDDEDADVHVALNHEPHVVEESAWLIDAIVTERSDRNWLRTCDARIELGWDLQEVDLCMGMVEYLRGEFETLCKGVTWDQVNDELMEPY